MNYHGKIMNIGANCTHAGSPREDVMRAYIDGHKRARHEASEIANDADAEIELLHAAITALADTELRELACIGSHAPVEDALGRLFALVPNALSSGARSVPLERLVRR